jgi:cytochrome P450
MLPPGPGAPAPLQTLRWLRQPVQLMERCRGIYGDVFTLNLVNARRLVVTSNPEIISALFTGDPEMLRAGAFNKELQPLFGSHSLLLLDGERHLRERKLLLMPFHGKRMSVYEQQIGEIVAAEVEAWPLRAPFSLYERMANVTFDVIMRTVFGLADEHREHALREGFRRLVATGGLMLAFPGLRRSRVRPWRRFAALKADVDAKLLELVRERRRDPRLDERADVLALMLQARDEGGVRMSDGELRDELTTLLLAGHETTATALAWLLDYVLREDDVVQRLRDPDDAYVDAVVSEALRLRPVIPIVGRTLAQPIELGRWRLPAGANVVPSLHLLHRRPELFPQPDAFRPERFLQRRPAVRYSFVPFGGGTRRCIGASFAAHEMRIIVREVFARTRLRLTAAERELPVRHGPTIAPAGGTRAVLEERRAAR